MRTPRQYILPMEEASLHKIWRAHNKDFLLIEAETKKIYLRCLFKSVSHKSVDGAVKIHAYCIMSNHVHELVTYNKTCKSLSTHMRISHSKFGQIFNKKNNRQGPVAYDRPKTPLIEPNDYHLMQVHFYIESNPLRAGMVKDLKYYPYSTYRFYAYGIRNEFSDQLTIPEWYIKLGSTPIERQRKYRSLFFIYLKNSLVRHPHYTVALFIGDTAWVLEQKENFKKRLKEKLDLNPPPI